MNSTRKRLTLVKPTPVQRDDSLFADTGQFGTEPESDQKNPPEALGHAPTDNGAFRHNEILQTTEYLTEVREKVCPTPEPKHRVTTGAFDLSPNNDAWIIKIDFASGSVAKRLARKLKNEVENWGDTILYSHALTIVARMFGHDTYQAMHHRFELANPSETDAEVGVEERAKRYRQYVSVLSQNDFSFEEAKQLLDKMRVGPWCDFASEWIRSVPQGSGVRQEVMGAAFRDMETAYRLFGVFKKSLKANGVEVKEGPKRLFAKLFGHEAFGKVLNAAEHGKPTVLDFFLGPAALDQRVIRYLEVFADAGINQAVGLSLLRNGYGGWFNIEENEWESLRQSRRADRIENGLRPRWRPRRLKEVSKPYLPPSSE